MTGAVAARRQRPVIAVTASITAAVALVLSGCGSSGASTSHSSGAATGPATTGPATTGSAGAATTSRSASTSTSAGTTVPLSSTASGTPSATTSGAPQARTTSAGCAARQLGVSIRPGGAGVSHVGVILRFRDTGASSCTLTGYPGVALVTSGGRQVQAVRVRSGYLGGLASSTAALSTVRLAPGQTASAMLEGLDADVAHGGGPCPRYVGLLVTPPNQMATVSFPNPLRLCRPEVHPVLPGATGRGT